MAKLFKNTGDRKDLIDLMTRRQIASSAQSQIGLCEEIGLSGELEFIGETGGLFAKRLVSYLDTNSDSERLNNLFEALLENTLLNDGEKKRLRTVQKRVKEQFEEQDSDDVQAFRERLLEGLAQERQASTNNVRMPKHITRLAEAGPGHGGSWELIDSDYFKNIRPAEQEAIRTFFDGREPGWPDIVSGYINPRKYVDELKQHLQNHRLTGSGPQVLLLTGAGSEGKTTVMMQTVYEFVKANPQAKVLWHTERNALSPWPFMGELSPDGLLIVSDYADQIGGDLFKAVQEFNTYGTKIQFLLSCHVAEWERVVALYGWWRYASGQRIEVKPLTRQEADTILQSWKTLNSLGTLKVSVERQEWSKAVDMLLEYSKEELARNVFGEGSFLSALLEVRSNTAAFAARLQDMMNRLDEHKILNSSLSEALLCIAAMHDLPVYNNNKDRSEHILTRPVLAGFFGLSGNDAKFQQEVLRSLKGEASQYFAGNERILTTRGRKIAHQIVEIVRTNDEERLERVYINLVRSASQIQPNLDNVSMDLWNKVGRELFARGEDLYKKNMRENGEWYIRLALRVAQAHLKLEDTDKHLFLNLAQLLRRAAQILDDPELRNDGLRLFRKDSNEDLGSPKYKISRDRAYYYEWATSEGIAGNNNLDIWLSGMSLMDSSLVKDGFTSLNPEKLTNNSQLKDALKRVGLSMNGLAHVFIKQGQKSNEQTYFKAAAGSVRLAFELEQLPYKYWLNDKTKHKLGESKIIVEEKGIDVDSLSLRTALTWIEMGLGLTKTKLNFPAGLFKGDMTFNELAMLARIQKDSDARR